LAALAAAIAARAKADAAAAIADLGGASFAGVEPLAAESQLKGLMGRRWFDLAILFGDILVRAYEDEHGIRKRFGQALVERGELARARAHFERLLGTDGIPPSDRYEYLGLVGRTYKQQFVNTERQTGHTDGELLRRAIDVYLEGYRADTKANTWHGVNVIALSKLAQRRGVEHAASASADLFARAIIRDLTLAEGRKHWDQATLTESCVALGEWTEAEAHLRDYLWYPGVDPFSVGSTLRQFEEIWEIHREDPGASLVTLLRARLLEMEDGRVELSPEDIRSSRIDQPGHYEKVFGTDHFLTLKNYRLGLERCAPVARIGRDTERGDGTGFLMRGSDLDPRIDGIVLLTNAHVIDPTGESEGLHPTEVIITFQTLAGVEPSQEFTVSCVIWSSKRTELDATIVRLDPTPPLPVPYPIAGQIPMKGSRVIAIGHPGGGTLSLSLNDNELLDFESSPGCKLHYRTPTEGGSSGSPIFTKEWKLVSLHHYGGDAVPRLNGASGTYQANEGISILAIREALKAAQLPAC